MAIKLFVTDLDGTLLPTGTKVSEKNIKAVRDAAAAGVTVTIATGRMYRASLPVARALGVNVPIITYNGALIKSVEGEVLYDVYLDPELVREVMDFCEAKDWYIQTYSNDELYFPVHDEHAQFYEREQKLTGKAVGWEALRNFNEHVPKLLSITADAEETQTRIRTLQKEFDGRMIVVSSNPRYAEIIPLGVSKAAAIGHLAEKMGIRREEIMAIGDSNNDLSMLKAAGKSVAMGNAIPEVKEVCDYVTETCEEDGFAEAVYRYVLK